MDMITGIAWVTEVLTALCCMIYLLLVLNACETAGDRNILKTVIVYISAFSLTYLSGAAYRVNPSFYVSIAPLVLFLLMISPVLLYRIVYGLTDIKDENRFSRFHFVVPIFITLIWTVITSLSIPRDIRVDIIRNFALPASGYGWQSVYFTSLSLHLACFGLIYLPLSFIRLLAYRNKITGENHPDSRYRMRWMGTVIILSIVFTFSGALVSFTGNRHIYFNHLNAVTQSLANIILLSILTLNILRKNYPPRKTANSRSLDLQASVYSADPINPENEEPEKESLPTEKTPVKLSKASLESFFRSEKPWLDPGLTLVDLAEKLGTNRVMLSGFINRTYGVNFNTWVNEWRLQELERLRRYKKYSNRPIAEVIALAGFGSYDSYRRAKEAYKRKEREGEQ